ncbi:response regulator [Dehalogenimonas sp. THU2]|uniref:response regulator n=1 Tax=Dehalogenimonas sp. THU2 TaxID=3151121 RepID=UPI003218B6C7
MDDEPSICEICKRVLAGCGLSVDCACDGRDGRQLIEINAYYLIILDIRMPVSSGKDFFRYLKTERQELIDCVLLTSGDLMNDDTEAFVRSSGRPFLPKPFSPDELKSAVGKLYLSLHPGTADVNFI